MEGQLIRNNLNVDLNDEGAECNMNGLYMMKSDQHVDNHTLIKHVAPNCLSNELYKGILNEQSKGVFNGKVMVMPYAQKTNAFQSNANILLTDEAQVFSKPELEIYADDVKCSHGSTTGQLDEEALFYLQTRGMTEDGARNLLLYAFAKEVLEKLSNKALKEEIDQYIANRYHTQMND
jgi:Fe-S cluster assembly protein SufD